MERGLEGRFNRVQQQLAKWRAEHGRPTPIPSTIWEGAVDLSESLGLTLVARELRLDYSSLKKRVESRRQGPTFIEVLRPDAHPSSYKRLTLGRCSVECELAPGRTLKIQLEDPGSSELAAFLKDWAN